MTIKELKNRLKEIAVEAKAAETSGDDAKLDKLIEEANTINDKLSVHRSLLKSPKMLQRQRKMKVNSRNLHLKTSQKKGAKSSKTAKQ